MRAGKGRSQEGEGEPDHRDPVAVGTVMVGGHVHMVTGVHKGLHQFVGSPWEGELQRDGIAVAAEDSGEVVVVVALDTHPARRPREHGTWPFLP